MYIKTIGITCEAYNRIQHQNTSFVSIADWLLITSYLHIKVLELSVLFCVYFDWRRIMEIIHADSYSTIGWTL